MSLNKRIQPIKIGTLLIGTLMPECLYLVLKKVDNAGYFVIEFDAILKTIKYYTSYALDSKDIYTIIFKP